jgi:Uma2 family endonuclease
VKTERRYVSPMSASVLQTAEDLLRFREPGKTAELIRGVLVVREPPSTSHGARANRLAYRVTEFAERQALGRVFAQDTGFKIARAPDTVRAPDVAFVAQQRLDQIADEGYAEVAPDWVAEILSPGDRPGEVLEKVGQWLDAGVRLVWVVDPARRAARVYRADGTVSMLGPLDDLDGEDVFPGFRLKLSEVL